MRSPMQLGVGILKEIFVTPHSTGQISKKNQQIATWHCQTCTDTVVFWPKLTHMWPSECLPHAKSRTQN